jgi:hypothetical protein
MPRGPATLAVAGQPKIEAVPALISEAAARGASLTSHLLAFGKPSQPRAVDVNSLLVDHADALLLAKPCRTADLANMIRAALARTQSW